MAESIMKVVDHEGNVYWMEGDNEDEILISFGAVVSVDHLVVITQEEYDNLITPTVVI